VENKTKRKCKVDIESQEKRREEKKTTDKQQQIKKDKKLKVCASMRSRMS